MHLFNKINETIQNEGVGSILLKSSRRARYAILRALFSYRTYEEDWASLRGKFAGERVFLIGNGPSLNKTPLYYLRDEYTLCFNRFNLMRERLNWVPSFYMTVDNLVIKDLIGEFEDVTADIDYVFMPDIHFRGEMVFPHISDSENVYWIKQRNSRGFSTQLPYTHVGGTVIGEGMQILHYLGFEKVYLIGVDMSFSVHENTSKISGNQTDVVSKDDDDPNHFDPRYFGKNRAFHQPTDYVVRRILDDLNFIADAIRPLDYAVINAGYDSALESFPRADFKSLFSYSNQERKQLIDECFAMNTSYAGVDVFVDNAISLSMDQDSDDASGNFYVSAARGEGLLGKLIFTHLPIGPYNDTYFFVSRKFAT